VARTRGLLLIVRCASQAEVWRNARIRTEALVSGARRPRPRTGQSAPGGYSSSPTALRASARCSKISMRTILPDRTV